MPRPAAPLRPDRTHGALLQKRSRGFGTERVELDFDCLAAPIGEARRHQHACAGGGNEIAQQVGRLDIVIDQEKGRPQRPASCAKPARAARS